MKMPQKLYWHLKCHFLATNIEQHVLDLSTYVAYFGILVAYLGFFNFETLFSKKFKYLNSSLNLESTTRFRVWRSSERYGFYEIEH